jgi:DNA-binding MarR family transcriptional regulator
MSDWLNDKQKRAKWTRFVRRLNPDANPQSLQIMDELRYLSRVIHYRNEQSLGEAGLSSAQYRVLLQLFFAEEMDGQGELNPSKISERQGVSRNTISSLIGNLEASFLVERRIDAADRRRFNISLTTAGRDLVITHARSHLEMIGQYFEALSVEERESLLKILAKIRGCVMAAPDAVDVARKLESA